MWGLMERVVPASWKLPKPPVVLPPLVTVLSVVACSSSTLIVASSLSVVTTLGSWRTRVFLIVLSAR